MGIGAMLFTGMGIKTENTTVIIYMIVIGFGLGVAMPIFNVTAQNAVSENQIGVATSSIQFFKYMGQTISASVMATVLTLSMKNGLEHMNTGALPSNIAAMLKDPNALSNSSALKSIMATVPQDLLSEFSKVIEQMKEVLSDSIHRIFILCVIIAAIAIISMLFMKEVPISRASDDTQK